MVDSVPRPLASSRYPEDVLSNGHAAVYGSFYCLISQRWGYSCCLLFERDAACTGPRLALEGAEASSAPLEEANEGADKQADENQDRTRQTSAGGAEVPDRERAASGPASARAAAEFERILAAPASKPLAVLGLTSSADAYAVRNAFRRIALLVHPDKNPGHEERCRQALLKVQEAREAIEAQKSGKRPGETEKEAKKRRKKEGPDPHFPPRAAAPASTEDATAGSLLEPEGREQFASAEDFVAYALQFVLDLWRKYIHLPLAGSANVEVVSRLPRASDGCEGVLRSEPALKQAAESVKELKKLLKKNELGATVLGKIETLCAELLKREYAVANKAYMDLAIGNKTWHLEVPSLLEGGMAGLSGVERGQMFKQARAAAKLNKNSAKGVMDDEDVRAHILCLRRLCNVTQAIRPNSDPSKSSG
eukprot:TRINITY_DN81045_c0_g1_i1.p1 TRINITY_DN81045_c0_g1~~TRINITY_DN81045_c0_g1_i1.p1  ORF type:complete len:430 (-),score=77.77 TRINITY_DN81045_c0_g1_i1:98-1363(-)